MKLREVFEMLQYGELANVSMSGDIDEPSGIKVEDYPSLISHINLALTDLHTKFNLKEREVVIQQYDQLSYYELDHKFAKSNLTSDEPIKFIIDSEFEPFLNDIVQITQVYNEGGIQLPLNDEMYVNSLYLVNYNTIQVPYPNNDNALFIRYQANHPKLKISSLDLDSEVDLPSYLVEALLSYVASRVHSQRTSQEAQGTAVNLMSKYNMICDQVKEKNILNTASLDANYKLGERGWV